jgi:hypothetical protein
MALPGTTRTDLHRSADVPFSISLANTFLRHHISRQIYLCEILRRAGKYLSICRCKRPVYTTEPTNPKQHGGVEGLRRRRQGTQQARGHLVPWRCEHGGIARSKDEERCGFPWYNCAAHRANKIVGAIGAKDKRHLLGQDHEALYCRASPGIQPLKPDFFSVL